MITKICKSCQKEFPATAKYFDKNKAKKDGLRIYCKICAREYQRKLHEKRGTQKNREHQKYHKDKRLKQGLCEHCRNKRLPTSKRNCEKHWYFGIAKARLGTTKLWKKIKQLAEQQNFMCVYTGEKLSPGVNMSLDHILPISSFPELEHDITNVQWVSKRINTMKRNLTHDEFLNLCHTICYYTARSEFTPGE